MKSNQALALCVNVDRGLSKKQNRTLHENLVVSGMVEPEGFEPSSKRPPYGLSTCLFSD